MDLGDERVHGGPEITNKSSDTEILSNLQNVMGNVNDRLDVFEALIRQVGENLREKLNRRQAYVPESTSGQQPETVENIIITNEDDVSIRFPLRTMDELLELQNDLHADIAFGYIQSISEEHGRNMQFVFRQICSDELVAQLCWEFPAKDGKQSMQEFRLFSSIFKDAVSNFHDSDEYALEIQKAEMKANFRLKSRNASS